MEDSALCGLSVCLVIIADEYRNKKKHNRWGRGDLFDEGPRLTVGLLYKLRLNETTGITNFIRLTALGFKRDIHVYDCRGQIMKQDTNFREKHRRMFDWLSNCNSLTW